MFYTFMLPTIDKINASTTGRVDPSEFPDINRTKFSFKTARSAKEGEEELDDTDI